MEASNRAKASIEDMIHVFQDKIKKESLIINDGILVINS